MRLLLFIYITILIAQLMVSSFAHAENKFYNDKERGWYYFESQHKKQKKGRREQETKELNTKTPDKTTTNSNPLGILQQLEAVQQQLEIKKAKFVLYPTIENAKEFMAFQKQVFENASQASKAWQAALLKYPELNSTIENPISQQALKIKYEDEGNAINKKITEFSKHFELIYFFKGSCKYCHAFIPVLSNFTTSFNFKIRAISLDNTRLDEFRTEINPQLIEDLEIKVTPTLIAYNAENNVYLPIAQGYLAEDELKRNVALVYDNITKLVIGRK